MSFTFGSLKASATNVLQPTGPGRAGSTVRRPVVRTEFRKFYDRGDMPMQIFHGAVGGKIAWKVDIEKLDYHHYLPILFDGLREKEDPYPSSPCRGPTTCWSVAARRFSR